MKAKIFGSLFALPFFSIGVWMLWSIGTTLVDAWQDAANDPAHNAGIYGAEILTAAKRIG